MTNLQLIDREEFDRRLAELSETMETPTLRLLLAMKGGFDSFPRHLKEEAYSRLGVRPVEMYEVAQDCSDIPSQSPTPRSAPVRGA